MTTYFVSRHPGALQWAKQRGITVDHQLAHLHLNDVRPGDWILGTLPVHLAAEVCARGARYFHLSMDIPEPLRGRDLDAEQMSACNARLECYVVKSHPAKL